jgi:hypothetical protein
MGCEDPEAMEENQQLVRSLHCAFSKWYNSSVRAEGPMAMSHQTNGSRSLKIQMEDFTSKWQALMPPRHTSIMHVCPILSFLAVFFVVPESLPDKMRLSSWGFPISWEQADPFAVSLLVLVAPSSGFNNSFKLLNLYTMCFIFVQKNCW